MKENIIYKLMLMASFFWGCLAASFMHSLRKDFGLGLVAFAMAAVASFLSLLAIYAMHDDD